MHSHEVSPRFAGLAGDSIGADDHRPALVLLHGLTYDRRMWGPALDELGSVDPGRRVLSLDLPGHGESPRFASYGLDQVLPALHAAVQDAGLHAPVLVGHSLGAVLATVYAARYRTSGVINVDQPLRTAPFAELLQAHEETLRGPEYLTLWSTLTAGMHTELLPAHAQELLRTITDPRQDLLLGYWDDLLTMPPAELDDRMAADLTAVGETGVPYHFVYGHTPSANHQAWLGEIFPAATSTVLPDSGHFPQLARPATFARILAATGTATG